LLLTGRYMRLLRVLGSLLLSVVVRIVVVPSIASGVRVRGVLASLRVGGARGVRRQDLGVSLTSTSEQLSEDEHPEKQDQGEEDDGQDDGEEVDVSPVSG
jgi:hypothetical protein